VTHAFLAAQSQGLDLAETPLPRFLPLRVYLSEDTPEIVESVKKAISGVLDVQGLEIADDFPAETGSWWKKWMVRSKDFLTQDEVAERLNKIERAVEMKVLHEPQADVDKKSGKREESGTGRKAGQVRYWQYGQAEKSPDLAISDLSRFPVSRKPAWRSSLMAASAWLRSSKTPTTVERCWVVAYMIRLLMRSRFQV
jgi:hypothetical protein